MLRKVFIIGITIVTMFVLVGCEFNDRVEQNDIMGNFIQQVLGDK